MVTLALLTETRAEGPLAKTTLGVVLVADVVVVLVFTAAFSLAQASLGGATASAPEILVRLLREVVGSILAGALIGGVLTLYLRFVRRELVVFAVVLVFATAAAAPGAPLRAAPEPAGGRLPGRECGAGAGRAAGADAPLMAVPVFVIFFAMAGAELRLQTFEALWPLVLDGGAGSGWGDLRRQHGPAPAWVRRSRWWRAMPGPVSCPRPAWRWAWPRSSRIGCRGSVWRCRP